MMNTQTSLTTWSEPTADYRSIGSAQEELSTLAGGVIVRSDGKRPVRSLHDFNDLFANEIDESTISNPFKLSVTDQRLKRPVVPVQEEVQAEWSGCVEEVHNEASCFTATLRGIKGKGVKGELEDAVIPIADVNKSDMELLRPGNYFRLCAMYEVTPSGQPRRFTQVIFRRMPAYRQKDLDEALQRGRELSGSLRVE